MTKARFYISGKVQDVGYRPYIMKEIIKREGLNGIADNYKLPERIAKELKEVLKHFLSKNPFASQKPLRKIRFAERTCAKRKI